MCVCVCIIMNLLDVWVYSTTVIQWLLQGLWISLILGTCQCTFILLSWCFWDCFRFNYCQFFPKISFVRCLRENWCDCTRAFNNSILLNHTMKFQFFFVTRKNWQRRQTQPCGHKPVNSKTRHSTSVYSAIRAASECRGRRTVRTTHCPSYD